MAAVTYATVGSNRLEDAKAFYDALLRPFGITPLFEHPSGGRVYGAGGQITFGVVAPFDGQPATVGNGTMISFSFDTREEVDAFHAGVLALGGACEGPPGLRAPSLYFTYVRDLDGNKLSGYHVG
jgi:hypothetical protein